ncbi:AMP-binding protein [Streptomyces sp. M19]
MRDHGPFDRSARRQGNRHAARCHRSHRPREPARTPAVRGARPPRASAVAVVCGRERLTYAELDRRAECLARHLLRSGLAPGGIAAVCLERGPALLVAALGVLKAGGAYAAMDAGLPEPELNHLLEDLDPAVLIARDAPRSVAGWASREGRPVICPDTDGAPEAPVMLSPDPRSPACVLYTAGTTGRPRGVVVTHRQLVIALEGGGPCTASYRTTAISRRPPRSSPGSPPTGSARWARAARW